MWNVILSLLLPVLGLILSYASMRMGWHAGVAHGIAVSQWKESDQLESAGAPGHVVEQMRASEIRMRTTSENFGGLVGRWSRKSWKEWDQELARIKKVRNDEAE